MKHIGEITAAERGSLVIMTVAVSATGNIISSFFVLLSENFRDQFIANG
jgi:hypothetical protein